MAPATTQTISAPLVINVLASISFGCERISRLLNYCSLFGFLPARFVDIHICVCVFSPVSQRLNATSSLCAASVVVALRPRWKRGALAVPAADALCRFLRDHGSVDVRWSAADADGDAVLCTGPAAAATTSGGGHSGRGTRNADGPEHSRASTRLRFTHQAVVELGFPCQTSVSAESASAVGWILSV